MKTHRIALVKLLPYRSIRASLSFPLEKIPTWSSLVMEHPEPHSRPNPLRDFRPAQVYSRGALLSANNRLTISDRPWQANSWAGNQVSGRLELQGQGGLASNGPSQHLEIL
jgi:hypothetical protein